MQDTIIVVLPYPYSIEDAPADVPFEDCWYARPIPCLYVAPVSNMLGRVPLIPLFLAGNSTPTIPHKFSKHKGSAFPMGSADTANASADGRRGSNVYEVNHWLWMFGRGKPRLGGLSVAETAVWKSARHEDQVKRAVEARRRRKAAKALIIKMKRVCVDDVCTSTYRYVPVCTSMYLRYLKFEFFKLDLDLTDPRILLHDLLLWSVMLLQFIWNLGSCDITVLGMIS